MADTKITEIIAEIQTRLAATEKFERIHLSPRKDYGEDLPAAVLWPESTGVAEGGADGKLMRECSLQVSVIARANSDVGQDLSGLIAAMLSVLEAGDPLPHNSRVAPGSLREWDYETNVTEDEGNLVWAWSSAQIQYETVRGDI